MLIASLANLNPYQELVKFDQLLVAVPTDLKNQETWRELQCRAALAVKYSQVGPAFKLFKRLQGELFKQSQEIKDRYEPILVWLQYAAMPGLAPGELVDFFKEFNFTIILHDEDFNDLSGMLRLRLSLEDINDRDGWREKIYNAMHDNQKVIVEFSGVSIIRTTVADWLKLYDSAIGLEPAESIAVAEFNNQNAMAFKLDEGGKALWKRLVDFYEYLKLSSSDALGFEEDIVVAAEGKNYLLSNGEQIDLARIESEFKPVATKFVTPSIVETVTGASLPPLPEIIKSAQAQLMATNGDAPKVIAELQKNLGAGQVLGVLASLLLLAQLRRLDDVLADAPAFRALVAQDLEKSGQAVQQEGLNAQPSAPQFLARFLKIVLQDNLHINSSDALSFAVRLGELMALEGEGYRKIITTDERGQAKWNT